MRRCQRTSARRVRVGCKKKDERRIQLLLNSGGVAKYMYNNILRSVGTVSSVGKHVVQILTDIPAN